MNKCLKFLYCFTFVICICLFNVIGIIFAKFSDSLNYENREKAHLPEFSFSEYDAYPTAFEKYYNDNLPFRNNLIEFNSKLIYSVFHSPMNRNVILGDNSWLFYNSKSDGDPMSCYRGTNILSEEQLIQLSERLQTIGNLFKQQDIEFVIFIAPNKERIYSEYLSDQFGRPASLYRARQIVDYISQNTDICIIYPYTRLITYKSDNPDRLLYYKTDTHWNSLGGYIGAYSLLNELNISIPDPESSKLHIEKTEYTPADLAGLLHLTDELAKTDLDYTITGYDTHECTKDENSTYSKITYHSKNSDNRKIYVQRDSFCSAMLYYIASQFDESIFTNEPFSYDSLAAEDPDIFVFEVAERYIDNLIDFSMISEGE